jgi:hypothetical protein
MKNLLREGVASNLIINSINESKIDFNLISEANGNDKNRIISYIFESLEDDMFDVLTDTCVLTFSKSNSKLGASVTTFSLPAGWTCPYADKCLKKVHRDRVIDPEKEGTYKISKKTGEKIPYKGDVAVEKGKNAEFDCYAANQELQYDAVRANRWHNYDLLDGAGDAKGQADLIEKSLNYFFMEEGETEYVRIHESGDFYNGEYFKAWIEVARRMPNTKFYAYTKSIPFIQKYDDLLDKVPNLILTVSKGGKRDRDIENVDVKESKVFNTPEEVLEAGLIVDLDDSLAQQKGGKGSNFALLVHGTQEKGEMSQNKMRNETFMAYWKYRKMMNQKFNMPSNTVWSLEAGKAALMALEKKEKTDEKGYKKMGLPFFKKLANYVVKYHNYGFSDELINILPEKYRP